MCSKVIKINNDRGILIIIMIILLLIIVIMLNLNTSLVA